MRRVRLAVPQSAEAGEVIELKAMIQHPMENGFRRDSRGGTIPQDIVKEFVCLFDGEPVFEAEFFTAVSANPILTFYFRAERSGTLEFRWTDQHGDVTSDTRQLTVA